MSEERLWKFRKPEWLNSVYARNAGVYSAGALVSLSGITKEMAGNGGTRINGVPTAPICNGTSLPRSSHGAHPKHNRRDKTS